MRLTQISGGLRCALNHVVALRYLARDAQFGRGATNSQSVTAAGHR